MQEGRKRLQAFVWQSSKSFVWFCVGGEVGGPRKAALVGVQWARRARSHLSAGPDAPLPARRTASPAYREAFRRRSLRTRPVSIGHRAENSLNSDLSSCGTAVSSDSSPICDSAPHPGYIFYFDLAPIIDLELGPVFNFIPGSTIDYKFGLAFGSAVRAALNSDSAIYDEAESKFNNGGGRDNAFLAVDTKGRISGRVGRAGSAKKSVASPSPLRDTRNGNFGSSPTFNSDLGSALHFESGYASECNFCLTLDLDLSPISCFDSSRSRLLTDPRLTSGLDSAAGHNFDLHVARSSEEELPTCRPHQVCSKVDLYDPAQPWIERKCRCIGHRVCSSNLSPDDNHSLSDKTTLYKTCEPIKRLPKCRYFKDAAWTLFSLPDSNATQQIVNCHCPKLSVTYLLKKLPYTTPSGEYGNQYQFACSPQSRLRCSRKEPCKLFSVRRRHELIDEVNASTVCQCPRDHSCPRRHSEPGVLAGLTYAAEDIRTYHGYCVPELQTERRFVGDKD
ncbi:Protein giant-lens [Eumeta japonica]|uniref:Protein giant-lens n=1 Tax=Eumeta variegata TaxID=151549 RepID=A0A4C1ZIU4_EUMVA|nr:Protein giant-lens [Eumeta japonica]